MIFKYMNKVRKLKFYFFPQGNEEDAQIINRFYFDMFDKLLAKIREKTIDSNMSLKYTKV